MPRRDHEDVLMSGNLIQDMPAEFLETVWEGCAERDCLPKCDTINYHCERLKIELETWLNKRPKPTPRVMGSQS
jgi:hypothetical protein